MRAKPFLLLVGLLLLPALLLAAGKIKGKVIDKESKEGLIGANVQIVGTISGAATDVNGDFTILNVPPGVYTVKTTFVGYASVSISNIRVNNDLTTTVDFQLSSSAVELQDVTIVAERPLIQRNTTNTVRLNTQEDIENLPVRGVQNVVALQAGVVQQDGNLYVRGGRAGEIAFYIDGTNTTNPLTNQQLVGVIQESVEEVQLQAGGYTAEFGGSNSGIVRTSLRTGGEQYHASVNYLTDDFAKGGEKFIGTSSFGYRNAVLTFSGPIPGAKQVRFFLSGQNNYIRDQDVMFLTPFSFNLLTDGVDGRPAGMALPAPVALRENYLPNNWRDDNLVQGTFTADFQPFKFRASGSYEVTKNLDPNRVSWPGALNYIFSQNRAYEETRRYALINFRATHLIDASTFYELGFSYQERTYNRSDPDFGEDWTKYDDSTANAAIGYTNFRNRWAGPLPYSVVDGFVLQNENRPNTGYQKNSQKAWGVSGDFTRQMNKNWELKFGGKFDRWTMRQYIIGSITGYMTALYGANGLTPGIWATSLERSIALEKAGSINNYGYDADGNWVTSGPEGPQHPILASGYLQNKMEYNDLVLNVGLRYEMYKPNHKVFADQYHPDFNLTDDVIDQTKLVDAPTYSLVLPRISVSFPVTANTVFYAQYGKYAQMPSLNNVYVGNTTLSRTVSPTSRGNAYLTAVGYLAAPERTTQYEIGFRQTLTDRVAFTMSGFYKDTRDQLEVRSVFDVNGTQLYKAYLNDDFGTVKGVELTLELRRTNRLAARVNYTLSDARGTGSNPQAAFGAIEQGIGRVSNQINPLDFNQVHRGTVMLDYRWDKNDGGPILSGLGANLLLSFNSGHPYTKIQDLQSLGQTDAWSVGVSPINDPRSRYPVEPINSSTTPFVFNIDLSVSKAFTVGTINFEVYANILNLLDTKQVLNVYPTTGTAENDGWLTNPLSSGYSNIPDYAAFYNAINNQNRWAIKNALIGQPTGDALDDLYGTPRQIRFGIKMDI